MLPIFFKYGLTDSLKFPIVTRLVILYIKFVTRLNLSPPFIKQFVVTPLQTELGFIQLPLAKVELNTFLFEVFILTWTIDCKFQVGKNSYPLWRMPKVDANSEPDIVNVMISCSKGNMLKNFSQLIGPGYHVVRNRSAFKIVKSALGTI